MAEAAAQEIGLRPAEQVMRLARLGSFHQCRLSFMRILMRRIQREAWRFTRPEFEISGAGVGHAVYSVDTGTRIYSLVAFAHDLPADKRSDRVIAEAWDATFTLFDGVPDAADIERLRANVPLQEAGRITGRELVLSRANRSVRLFEYVVAELAAGRQPDRAQVEAVGYLMRTTAVYGSGKFGAADRETLADRPEFRAPFQVEMLSVYLIRCFVMDLVEHLATARDARAVTLEPSLRRRFSIGNSTGLGMAPFLINHPLLLNNWIAAREEALARVRRVARASDGEIEAFHAVLKRAQRNALSWHSKHAIQQAKLRDLRADLQHLATHLVIVDLRQPHAWNQLYLWAEQALSLEGQELVVALMMEPYGEFIDELSDCMSADEEAVFAIDGAMSCTRLREIIAERYGWALALDWSAKELNARAWYVSEEKLEPRLGERFEEPIADYEQPLAPGRDAAALHAALVAETGSVASFLMAHPEHRQATRRAQIASRFPFAEIQDNTIAADMLPIDMLRCKLAFFGAGHFDPRSDRWVRINMFRGAPFPDELDGWEDDAWAYPR